jgi:hypothetical protein
MAALDWTRVDRIPPLAEPARLPAGAAAAVFNLLARLAAEQGVPLLHYDAPYPTESLFLTLLESFRYAPGDADDPLAAFARGDLAWQPAPHDGAVEAGGVWVQRRHRIEKVVAAGRAYHRPDWQGVRRLAPRVVRDTGDTVRASLAVLGRVLEDHLVLAPDGTILEAPAPPADPPEVAPLAPELVAGLVSMAVVHSAPALASALRAAARASVFEWGPVEADLIATQRDRVRLSHRWRRALAGALEDASSRAETLTLALAALREAGDLVGDDLRRRAQQALARAPEAEQAAALEAGAPGGDEDARAIAAAASALVAVGRGSGEPC